MKSIFCLIGKHKYETQRVFAGGNKWVRHKICVRCGHILEEHNYEHGGLPRRPNSKTSKPVDPVLAP